MKKKTFFASTKKKTVYIQPTKFVMTNQRMKKTLLLYGKPIYIVQLTAISRTHDQLCNPWVKLQMVRCGVHHIMILRSVSTENG
jgi:hypothetical protein